MADTDLKPEAKAKPAQPGTDSGAHHQSTWERLSSDLHAASGKGIVHAIVREEVSLAVDAAELYAKWFPPEKEHKLYRTADPIQSIKASDVIQGNVNDCFFMASLAAVADSSPKMIRDAIKENPDGSYTVTFPGAKDKPISVPKLTDSELKEYAKESPDGVWPSVMEKAFGIYLANNPEEKDKILMRDNKGVGRSIANWLDNNLVAPFRDPQALADTGDATAVLKLLTGFQAGGVPLKDGHSVEGAKSTLAGAFADNTSKVPVVAMIGDSNKVAEGLGLHPSHGYTVLGYANGLVTLRDPNGQTAPNDLGKAIPSKDGVFTMKVEDFAQAYDALYTGRLTPLFGGGGATMINRFRGFEPKKP